MRPLTKFFAIAALLVAGLGVGCGGPKDTPPGPLARHYDDMYIADVALDQKQAVVQAQNDWSVAKMENAKAESDFNQITTDLTGVRNEARAAQLSVETALSNKKAAQKSADTNQINDAEKNLRTAELLKKAADARVKYYEAVRNYRKVAWRHAQENMYWREAQYELAKSTLGQRNNKAPVGVSYDWFPKQEAERGKRTASAKSKTEAELGRANTARDNWLKAQKAGDDAAGKPSGHTDPMAPKVAPTTASE